MNSVRQPDWPPILPPHPPEPPAALRANARAVLRVGRVSPGPESRRCHRDYCAPTPRCPECAPPALQTTETPPPARVRAQKTAALQQPFQWESCLEKKMKKLRSQNAELRMQNFGSYFRILTSAF